MHRDALPSFEPVKALIRRRLVECALEVGVRRKTGHAGPAMAAAADLVRTAVAETDDPMPLVEHLIHEMSLECAVEVGAWRAHFPHHTFQREDSCITLKTSAS